MVHREEVRIDPERIVTLMGIGALWVVAYMCYGMWEVGHYLYTMATDDITQ